MLDIEKRKEFEALTFEELEIGEIFYINGDDDCPYIKIKSSREPENAFDLEGNVTYSFDREQDVDLYHKAKLVITT